MSIKHNVITKITNLKPKDLIKLIVDNSNYKDCAYNWKCIFCNETEQLKPAPEYSHIRKPPDIINSVELNVLELSFVSQDNSSILSVFLTKSHIENFILDQYYDDLNEYDEYSFKYDVDINNSRYQLTSISIIAQKNSNETIYDNKQFVF